MIARMRNPLVWPGCLLLVVTLWGCQTPPGQPAPAFRPKAAEPPDKSRIDDAKPAPEPAVLPRTHYAAGRLHESQNRLERAIEQYRFAIELEPTYVEAHNRLAICLARLGEYRAAEEHLTRAIQLRPDLAYLRNNLAFCYISQRRWADAEAELRNALQLRPDFARARINLAMTLAQQDRFDEALAAFRAVLTEADAQYNMGLMYQSRGRYADAGKAFRAALARNANLVAAAKRLEQVEALRKSRPESVAPMPSPATQPAPVARADQPPAADSDAQGTELHESVVSARDAMGSSATPPADAALPPPSQAAPALPSPGGSEPIAAGVAHELGLPGGPALSWSAEWDDVPLADPVSTAGRVAAAQTVAPSVAGGADAKRWLGRAQSALGWFGGQAFRLGAVLNDWMNRAVQASPLPSAEPPEPVIICDAAIEGPPLPDEVPVLGDEPPTDGDVRLPEVVSSPEDMAFESSFEPDLSWFDALERDYSNRLLELSP